MKKKSKLFRKEAVAAELAMLTMPTAVAKKNAFESMKYLAVSFLKEGGLRQLGIRCSTQYAIQRTILPTVHAAD